MYSGQQKSETSSCTPLPPAPPVERPKPCPRAPVSVRVTPGCGSSVGGGCARGRGLSSVGTVRSTGRGGGGGIARGVASGSGAGTARPPIGLIPPARGPGAPARLMVITVVGGSTAPRRQSGPKMTIARRPACAATDQASIEPNGSDRCWRAMITSATSLIVLPAV